SSAPFQNSPSVPVLPEDTNPGDDDPDDPNNSGDNQDDYHDLLQVLLPASPAPSLQCCITDTHLADALTALGHGLKHLCPSSVKICMPDTFAGASPQKLCENTPRPSRPGNPTPPSTLSSSSTPKPKPNLSNKLGKDSKLNSNKRKHQMENNLCLYCGAGGHMAKDCRKASTTCGCTANASTSTE
ncbi:hypothetical protein AX17_006557, partial [Amanita inopinata Kibby_2008]